MISPWWSWSLGITVIVFRCLLSQILNINVSGAIIFTIDPISTIKITMIRMEFVCLVNVTISHPMGGFQIKPSFKIRSILKIFSHSTIYVLQHGEIDL